MLFSIIVPVYNVKDYLEKCVRSVLDNACLDCELLLVDDGSTDGSGALCDALAAEAPEMIRVLHQENQGPGGARNAGIAAARGDYLFFLDSDDYIAPEALSVLKKSIAVFPGADIYSFDFTCDNGSGGLKPDSANCGPVNEPFTLREHPEFLLSLPAVWARIWRRDLFTRSGLRFPNEVWYEDIRTAVKLFAVAEKIVILKERLYFYLRRPGSIMNNKELARNRDVMAAFDDILSWYRQAGLLDTYRQELCSLAMEHVLLTASVRVSQIDPKSALLRDFHQYMRKNFPEYRKNPYRGRFSTSRQAALFLAEHRCYRLIALLLRLKS